MKNTGKALWFFLFAGIWSFSELVAGKFLRTASPELKGIILTAVSLFILSALYGVLKSSRFTALLTLLVVLVKFLAVPLFNWEFYFNSAAGLVLTGGLFTLFLAMFSRLIKKIPELIMLYALCTVFFAGLLFYKIGTDTGACAYLMTFSGIEQWFLKEILMQMIVCPFAAFAGFMLGTALTDKSSRFFIKESVSLYKWQAVLSVSFMISGLILNRLIV